MPSNPQPAIAEQKPPLTRKGSSLVWISIAVLCLLVPLTYRLLHLRYRIDHVDDAWSFAWAYQWRTYGTVEDIVFRGGTEPHISNFAMLYRLLYGWVGDSFGWTKSSAHLTSTGLVAAAALLWALSLKRLGYGGAFCAVFGLLFLLVEPIFGAANQARTDALAIFWIAAAVGAATRRSGLGVGLLAVFAFESHPAGAVHAGGFGLAVLGYSIFSEMEGRPRAVALKKALRGLIAGAAIGGLLYFAVYRDTSEYLVATLSLARRTEGFRLRNYFFNYFFQTRYFRNLPELAFFVLVLVFGFRSGFFRRYRLEALLVGVAVAASLLISRPNFLYVAFAYPAFLLLFLSFGKSLNRLGLTALGLTAFFSLQYSWVFVKHVGHNFPEQTRALRAMVPDDGLPVFGTANAWFAFYDRDFRHLTVPEDGLPEIGRGFYLVRSPADRYSPGPALKEALGSFILSRVGELEADGGVIMIDRAAPAEKVDPSPREDRT